MMKLKDVVLHLPFAFAGVLFMLQANSLVVQKFTIKIDIDRQIGDDSKKGPPGIKTVDLAYLIAADRTIANDGTSNYIISSMQMGKGSIGELSDDVGNRTTVHIKKLNQSVGYKTNDPDIIIKKNEFNQI
jgi:hypothetical protein